MSDFKDTIKYDLTRHVYVYKGNKGSVSRAELISSLLSVRYFPVFLYRLSVWFYTKRLRLIAKVISLINYIIFGIEISLQCKIGKGLVLPHTQGTVLGAKEIGENTTIFQGVTIGAKFIDPLNSQELRPVIGKGVTIGAGAKVLGRLKLGDGCVVGANAVVLSDVAPGQTVVGIPAERVKK